VLSKHRILVGLVANACDVMNFALYLVRAPAAGPPQAPGRMRWQSAQVG
jgi:hypothetical protein